MKIIDAFWEKKNLNIETKEIIVNNNDSLLDIDKIINSLSDKKHYIVIKIPIGRPDFIKLITDKGFYFIESLFKMSLRISTFQFPNFINKFDEMLTYKMITNSDEFACLENEIKKGIFTTDRIALDLNFGKDIAANRYVNWLKYEVKKECEVFEIIHENTPIGFFAIKKITEKKYNLLLGGLYKNSMDMGFGFSILSKPIMELKKRNIDFAVTHVSSNNLHILKYYFLFGFSPIDIVYVMTRI